MHFYVIKLRWLIAMAAVIVCIIAGICVDIAIPTFSVNGREIPIYSVERTDNKIALTFDCAWNDYDLEEILDTLDEYNAKATFFIMGEWAQMYPDSVLEIYKRGHEIGTHSMAHDDYTKMSAEEISDDMYACEQIILSITNNRPRLIRAPSGAYNDTVIKTCENGGRIYIQWSVDGIDYAEDATEDSIYNRVIDKTGAGDIILLHNGTEHTADVLPEILYTLSKDYELVKVSSLIYLDGFFIDGNGCQHKLASD